MNLMPLFFLLCFLRMDGSMLMMRVLIFLMADVGNATAVCLSVTYSYGGVCAVYKYIARKPHRSPFDFIILLFVCVFLFQSFSRDSSTAAVLRPSSWLLSSPRLLSISFLVLSLSFSLSPGLKRGVDCSHLSPSLLPPRMLF